MTSAASSQSPSAPAPSTISDAEFLQLKAEHNTDVDPPEWFLKKYPRLRPVLKHQELLKRFYTYDKASRAAKRQFISLGIISTILAAASLIFAALFKAFGVADQPSVALLLFLPGVLAIILVFITKVVLGLPNRWVANMFERERLRQWHFQKFLDGEFIESVLASTDPEEQLLEQLNADSVAVLGGNNARLNVFIQKSGADFYFKKITSYADSDLREQVLDVLDTLRFLYQYSYPSTVIERPSSPFTLRQFSTFLEGLGWVTLFLAVVLSLFQTGIAFTAWTSSTPLPPLATQLAFVTVVLGILSAIARTLKNGLTPTDEEISYSEYMGAVKALHATFRAAREYRATPEKILSVAQALENESISELRRFAKMKSKASFLT